VNGRSREVGPGFICALRPPDRHTFRSAPGESLAVMNVAFPRECLDLWRRRYAPQCAAIFPERAALPWSTELEESGLRWLAQAARELAAGQGSLLVLDRFFIEVFLRLAPGRPGREPVPEWLRAALAALRSPELFRRGPVVIAELAGRSPEHVNRTLRRYLGVTATGAFNAARLGWAADELRFTERPILEVGLGAGFAGLSHFYALFRARFGATPRAWRRRHRELAARVL
jgi:AraC family cel operon transcriptional repressor